jgi:uncharacterized cupredoxin-like copper-binding protein
LNIKTVAAAGLVLLAATAANAGPGHSGDHDEMAVGKPGNAAQVDRTVEIRMHETDDGQMLFEPASLEVSRGETIRFALANDGALDHEFVLDDPAKNQEHKEVMQRFPEMEHDDPNSARLAPGANGEIVWTFTNEGTFEFACLIPGHYESGMHAAVEVIDGTAAN